MELHSKLERTMIHVSISFLELKLRSLAHARPGSYQILALKLSQNESFEIFVVDTTAFS